MGLRNQQTRALILPSFYHSTPMPPKRTNRVVVLLTTVLLFLSGAIPGSAAPGSTEAAVRAIRQRYAEINAHAAKDRKVKKELAGFSAEGGTLVAYFDGEALAKIELTFYGESGEATEEYYYQDDKLVFVFWADSNYDHLRSGKIAHTDESRFYFRDDTLIAWIDAQAKPVEPGAGNYQDKQKECLQNSSEFSRAARSAQSTVEASR